ncbi:hypothetical protein [Intestinibacter sp.]|uniref:hypothetical protein n=1 Tax=Intestinibacter sp. TaxID=1965304 RepID=UPI002A919FAB|nr:hypothetical protein [Intestinibacter sp.]MDY5213305.1 hypothetical protein [Intestinibacter sp.]
MTNENNLNKMEGNFMELISTVKDVEIKDFEGDIFIISDGKFIKGLTGNEFLVYYAFLGIVSRHDNRGQHFIYKNDLSFNKLEQELSLKGKKEGTTMTRKTMKSTFDELVKKKVFKLATLDNGEEVYYIIQAKEYLFTRMKKETYRRFSRAMSGDALKIYCFIKGNLENVNKKGGSTLYLNRETIAVNCNITNKGSIGERQLKHVGIIMKTLKENFGLLEYKTSKRTINGNITGIYEITNIKEKYDE